jgi:hypothetical protein
MVIESTLSFRHFEIDLTATNRADGLRARDAERRLLQRSGAAGHQRPVGEALSHSRELWRGQHVFKVGTDLQLSHYDGATLSRPVEVRRLDGSLAERTEFGRPSSRT